MGLWMTCFFLFLLYLVYPPIYTNVVDSMFFNRCFMVKHSFKVLPPLMHLFFHCPRQHACFISHWFTSTLKPPTQPSCDLIKSLRITPLSTAICTLHVCWTIKYGVNKSWAGKKLKFTWLAGQSISVLTCPWQISQYGNQRTNIKYAPRIHI